MREELEAKAAKRAPHDGGRATKKDDPAGRLRTIRSTSMNGCPATYQARTVRFLTVCHHEPRQMYGDEISAAFGHSRAACDRFLE